MKNGYRGFCGELNAKIHQKILFLTYRDAKMTILTIKYGYRTTNRSIFNDPSESIMDGKSLKIPHTCGKWIQKLLWRI